MSCYLHFLISDFFAAVILVCKSWVEIKQLKKCIVSHKFLLPFLFPVVFAGFHFSTQELGEKRAIKIIAWSPISFSLPFLFPNLPAVILSLTSVYGLCIFKAVIFLRCKHVIGRKTNHMNHFATYS